MSTSVPPSPNKSNETQKSSTLSIQTVARQWERLFQHAPVGMIIVAVDGRIFEANPAYCSLLGYTHDELIGQTFGTLTHPDDRARDMDGVRKFLAGEIKTYRVRKRYLRKDGDVVWTDILVQCLYNDLGDIIGFFTTIEDAQQKQRAEEQTRLAEARFRALSAVTHDGIILCNNDKIEDINDALIALVGGELSDWIGKQTLDLFVKEERLRIGDALEHHAEFAMESLLAHKDGRRIPVELQVRNVQYLNRQLRGIAVRDVSERKLALEKAREAAEHERKLKVQADAILELSSPLIPITNEIMVMPLVGTLDSQRAQRIMDTLLTGITTRRASTAIIDITGVPVVDSAVASMLVKAAAGVRLLGAEAILTGIRPEVAQTLVTLGADLSTLTTCGTLQAGIAYAMNNSAGD